jgi:hypothetical protein
MLLRARRISGSLTSLCIGAVPLVQWTRDGSSAKVLQAPHLVPFRARSLCSVRLKATSGDLQGGCGVSEDHVVLGVVAFGPETC